MREPPCGAAAHGALRARPAVLARKCNPDRDAVSRPDRWPVHAASRVEVIEREASPRAWHWSTGRVEVAEVHHPDRGQQVTPAERLVDRRERRHIDDWRGRRLDVRDQLGQVVIAHLGAVDPVAEPEKWLANWSSLCGAGHGIMPGTWHGTGPIIVRRVERREGKGRPKHGAPPIRMSSCDERPVSTLGRLNPPIYPSLHDVRSSRDNVGGAVRPRRVSRVFPEDNPSAEVYAPSTTKSNDTIVIICRPYQSHAEPARLDFSIFA
jgi:hypothetical protein